MKKQDAINLFGGKSVDLAAAMNKTKQAISQWPEVLNRDQSNMVIGEATRRKIEIPLTMLL